MSNTYTLQDSIEQCKRGDQQAYFFIFESCQQKIFRYVISRVPCREDALDITQLVFVDVWQALRDFTYICDEAFFAFLFLVARRRIAKQYRSARYDIPLNEEAHTELYEGSFEDYRYLEKILKDLPENDQELIKLRYWGQLTFSEISEVLRITENNAKVRHHRIIKQLNTQTPNI